MSTTTGKKYAGTVKWSGKAWTNASGVVGNNTSYGLVIDMQQKYAAFSGFDLSSVPSDATVLGYDITINVAPSSTSSTCLLNYDLITNIPSSYNESCEKIGSMITLVDGKVSSSARVDYSHSSTTDSVVSWMNSHVSDLRSGNFGVLLNGYRAKVYSIAVQITYATQVTITTSVSPSGSGSVTGGGTYAAGASVTLTATPSTGYHFVQWNDGNTNASRSVTASADATYTATFAINSYTVSATVSPSGGGSVSGTGSYNYGATATLTATPSAGYHFVKWSDNYSSATRTFTVTSNASFGAIFELNSYVISTSVSPSGSGTVTGGGTYTSGTSVTLTATPSTGYHFVQWNDGNTNASRSITVLGNATYTAQFIINSYTIYLKDDEGNSLGSVQATHGSSPVITSTPTKASSGGYVYTFREWNTKQDGSGTSYSLNSLPAATASTTYFAQFDASLDEPDISSITILPNPATSGQGIVITVVFDS